MKRTRESIVGDTINMLEIVERVLGVNKEAFMTIDDRMCSKCKAFFAKYQCGKMIGGGECDCPKCQGTCTCYRKAQIIKASEALR